MQLSRSHPVHDICDTLAGDYPKDFVFDGWHPQCFCFVTPILIEPDKMAEIMSRDDWKAEMKRISDENSIEDYPNNFKEWVHDNEEKIISARERGTEPYFIRNNAGAIDGILNQDVAKKILTKVNVNATNSTTVECGISSIITPLTELQKQRRLEIRQIARTTIADKPIMIPGIERTATISSGKIKEWLNQPHEHIIEKNESLLRLNDLISKGEYIGHGIDKHDPTATAHLVRVKILGDDSWVVIRELNDGSIRIHSISDNHSIVDEIIKRNRKLVSASRNYNPGLSTFSRFHNANIIQIYGLHKSYYIFLP